MPYQKQEDLPASMRDHLPAHAQDFYRAAYNSAWDEYYHEEARAHRVAWAAVEHENHRDDSSGRWVRDATAGRG